MLSQSVSKNILGYETAKGRRVRYDKTKNIIVIGKLEGEKTKIVTMMRPVKGEEYYHENHRRDYSD